MINAKQLRAGTIIKYNDQLHEVVEAQHYKPGKGGAFVRSKLRNITTGSIISETLRPDDTFEQIYIEQQQMQFLYKDDMGYCFMDETTFEQMHISAEKLGGTAEYLKDNMTITANIFDGDVLTVTPPIHVVMKVIETEPGARGNTVSGATKPATLETGKIVKVPLFVVEGESVKVDTRTGEYIERA